MLASRLASGVPVVSCDVPLAPARAAGPEGSGGAVQPPVVGSFVEGGMAFAVTGEGEVRLVAAAPGAGGAASDAAADEPDEPGASASADAAGGPAPDGSVDASGSDAADGPASGDAAGVASAATLAIPASVEHGGSSYSVTSIGPRALAGCAAAVASIPASVSGVDPDALAATSVARVEVDPANPCFSSFDGALYDAALSRLLSIPGGRTGEVRIPDEAEGVEPSALSHCAGVSALSADAASPALSSWEGILYDKAGSTLLRVPPAAESLSIREGCSRVAPGALAGCSKLRSVRVPASVAEVDPGALAGGSPSEGPHEGMASTQAGSSVAVLGGALGAPSGSSGSGIVVELAPGAAAAPWESIGCSVIESVGPSLADLQEAASNRAYEGYVPGRSFVEVTFEANEPSRGSFYGKSNYNTSVTSTFTSGGLHTSDATTLTNRFMLSTKSAYAGHDRGVVVIDTEIINTGYYYSFETKASVGYCFKGWSRTRTASSGTPSENLIVTPGNAIDTPHSTITYYAIFQPIEYAITYELGGGGISGQKRTYTIEDDDFALPFPVRSGYTFNEWAVSTTYGTGAVTTYGDADPTRRVTTIRKGTYGDLTVRASWLSGSCQQTFFYAVNGIYTGQQNWDQKPNQANLTHVAISTSGCFASRTLFDLGTDEGSAPDGSKDEATVRIRTNVNGTYREYGGRAVANPGYHFVGWSTDPKAKSGAKSVSFTRAPHAPGDTLTYYAIFQPIEYAITYELGGGGISGQKRTYTIEDDDFALVRPGRSGYVFEKWSVANASGTGAVTAYGDELQWATTIKKGTYGDLTATASWLEGTHLQVYFRCDPDQGYFQGQRNWGEPYSDELPEVALATGGLTGTKSLFDYGTEDGKGTVRIRANVGNALRDYGGHAVARPGYRFVGWSEDAAATSGVASGSFERAPVREGEVVSQRAYLYAIFQPVISVDAPVGLDIEMDVLGVEAQRAGSGKLVSRSGAALEVAEVSCEPVAEAAEALFGWGSQDESRVSLTVAAAGAGDGSGGGAGSGSAGASAPVAFALGGPSKVGDPSALAPFALPGGYGSELSLSYGIAMPEGYAIPASYPAQRTPIARLTYTVRLAEEAG